MTVPPIAVVTPCRNYGRYLPDCIASVQAQTHGDYEHVIVLDGCTDDSLDVAFAAQDMDARVIIVHHRERGPRGVAAALNLGIATTAAPWVLVLAADDWIEPEYLATILELAAQEPAPDVVCAPCRIVGDGAPRVHRYPRYDGRTLHERHQIPGSAAMRREVWARVGGYDERLIVSSDWDFWTRAEHAAPLRVVQCATPMWTYRQHDAQRSAGWADRLPALKRHLAALAQRPTGPLDWRTTPAPDPAVQAGVTL